MSDCIDWKGPLDKDGYGKAGGVLAHRKAYVEAFGAVPPGMEIDHLCRNRKCVNPAHLEAVTHAENMLRRSDAQTHCTRGHEFTPENTYDRAKLDCRGRRTCRACNRENARRYAARRKAADLAQAGGSR